MEVMRGENEGGVKGGSGRRCGRVGKECEEGPCKREIGKGEVPLGKKTKGFQTARSSPV